MTNAKQKNFGGQKQLREKQRKRKHETADHVTKPDKEIDDHSPIRKYLVPPPSNELLALTKNDSDDTT